MLKTAMRYLLDVHHLQELRNFSVFELVSRRQESPQIFATFILNFGVSTHGVVDLRFSRPRLLVARREDFDGDVLAVIRAAPHLPVPSLAWKDRSQFKHLTPLNHSRRASERKWPTCPQMAASHCATARGGKEMFLQIFTYLGSRLRNLWSDFKGACNLRLTASHLCVNLSVKKKLAPATFVCKSRCEPQGLSPVALENSPHFCPCAERRRNVLSKDKHTHKRHKMAQTFCQSIPLEEGPEGSPT